MFVFSFLVFLLLNFFVLVVMDEFDFDDELFCECGLGGVILDEDEKYFVEGMY